MASTRKSVLGTENDEDSFCFASRFLKELKIWYEWREYISHTQWASNWWKVDRPLEVFGRVNFSQYLKDRGKLPKNVFVMDLYKVFLYYQGLNYPVVKMVINKMISYDWSIIKRFSLVGLDAAVFYLKEKGYLDRWERMKNAFKPESYDINWYY
jgi:hypothetical protein